MSRNGLSTVSTSFEMLELLSESPDATPSELAKQLDKPVSTVHGHLNTLESLGYLENEDGEYRISIRLLALGATAWKRNPLYEVGKPIVKRVAKDLGEQISLSMNDSGEPVVIYAESENNTINWESYPGLYLPTHGTAVGKLFLAHGPEEVRRQALEEELPQLTPNTITDPDALREEFRTITEEGISISREEYRLGLISVAAPVTYEQEVFGAVCLAAPEKRFSETDFEDEVRHRLLRASNTIEINLRNR